MSHDAYNRQCAMVLAPWAANVDLSCKHCSNAGIHELIGYDDARSGERILTFICDCCAKTFTVAEWESSGRASHPPKH